MSQLHPCRLHPRSTVRPYRADGRVYLQCVPEHGEPHFLQSAAASGPSLTVRATEGPSERRPYHGEALPFGLTPAELTVLQAAAQGLTVPETAVELHKGAETVKSQRNKIILKIGARNMTHAVCIAAEHGLVGSAAAAA